MWLLAVRVLQMVIAGAILGLAAAILTADFLLLALLGMSDAANLGIAIVSCHEGFLLQHFQLWQLILLPRPSSHGSSSAMSS